MLFAYCWLFAFFIEVISSFRTDTFNKERSFSFRNSQQNSQSVAALIELLGELLWTFGRILSRLYLYVEVVNCYRNCSVVRHRLYKLKKKLNKFNKLNWPQWDMTDLAWDHVITVHLALPIEVSDLLAFLTFPPITS